MVLEPRPVTHEVILAEDGPAPLRQGVVQEGGARNGADARFELLQSAREAKSSFFIITWGTSVVYIICGTFLACPPPPCRPRRDRPCPTLRRRRGRTRGSSWTKSQEGPDIIWLERATLTCIYLVLEKNVFLATLPASSPSGRPS